MLCAQLNDVGLLHQRCSVDSSTSTTPTPSVTHAQSTQAAAGCEVEFGPQQRAPQVSEYDDSDGRNTFPASALREPLEAQSESEDENLYVFTYTDL